MTESKEYYLASVEHGLVLSYKANGQPSGVSLQFKGDQDKEQKWTIESGDQPNRIALKCSATGRYLNTQEVCSGRHECVQYLGRELIQLIWVPREKTGAKCFSAKSNGGSMTGTTSLRPLLFD